MESVQNLIINALKEAVKELTGEDSTPSLSNPKDSSHGDYTSNIAMMIFASSKFKVQSSKLQEQSFKSPLELAEQIIRNLKLEIGNFKLIDHVEAIKPGFINFWISQDHLLKTLSTISEQKDKYGSTDQSKNKKIMVEFTDPNPFKEFHIGHLYSNIVGESLSRLFESQGAEVWRVTYQGDVGLHVAKAIWGLLNKFQISNVKSQINTNKDNSDCPAEQDLASPEILEIGNWKLGIKKWLEQIQQEPLEKRVKLLGEAYAMGAKAYEEDPKAKEAIHVLNKRIYQKDPEILETYEKGRQWSLDYFESIYERLGTKFVKNYFESVAGPIGLALVREHITDGVFKESEGAIIFEGKKYGLHDRVFINSIGLPTYEAKDMGLPPAKYKDFPYDRSIIITGEEQSGYFKVVLKALSLISPELEAKTTHISHGMVRLPEGKMSSRTGNVLTGEWLLDETKKHIKEAFADMDEQTLEMVTVCAVKYSLLKFSIGSDISFSFKDSMSLEGNSGPYLQYTYARTQSVLAKFQMSNIKFQINTNKSDESDWKLEIGNWKLEIEETNLLRMLYHFPEVVGEAAARLSPNIVCIYLFELAQSFNLFYQKHKILPSSSHPGEATTSIGSQKEDSILYRPSDSRVQNDNTVAFRLALTEAIGATIKNGLNLLGIQAPERM